MRRTFCGLLALSLPHSPGQEPKTPQRVKWDYKEATDNKLAEEGGLAKLGDDGWELVHVDPKLPYLTRTSTDRVGGTTVAYTGRVFYFKRPK